MSARLAPIVSQPAHDNVFPNSPSVESFSSHRMGFGPPPGLSFQEGLLGNVASPVNHPAYGMPNASLGSIEASQTSGSAHVSTSPSASAEPSAVPSPALSSSDFPALSASATESALRREQPPPEAGVDTPDDAAIAKAERKAAKKAAAVERAAERKRIAAERAAAKQVEKERIAQEKAAEKERQAVLKAEREKAAKEKAEKEKVERLEREKVAKEKAEQERAEREKAEKEKAERDRAAKERLEKEKADKERLAQAKKVAAATNTKTLGPQPGKQADAADPLETSAQPEQGTEKEAVRKQGARQPTPVTVPEPEVQVPILSKMPKKHKPNTKPIKIPKDDPNADPTSALPSSTNSEAPMLPDVRGVQTSSNVSRAQSVDRTPQLQHASVQELLEDLDAEFQHLNIYKHPFFDLAKINPAAKMPLEYGPLVHALSALSVGGGSFANNMPSGAIDNAVSSFQQLLETLTQTISDLLRLLPRKTWDDNSSFDGVLREMLKGDDFLDDGGGEDGHGQVREDEVAALTLALERRARWMEVQLSKLEELHRDINTAAVRAVLSFNDNGWDARGRLPRVGHTLLRFDNLGVVSDRGMLRLMTADELEKKLVVAKEAAAFAEAELRESMQRMQALKPMRAEH
ncbi:hypothetical protein DAEQUDRAFT_766950 [Daedalea quercina L-15889]|uniref:Uncharacterized protein n=1 Tax=Daedalea quercina L-15889 TaxID=1314783 RepID=A0A165P5V6_9APHY|nr:hypothetical protein DAEQUDRAFT_766950 [Daedalea quercina L-15889]